MGKYRDIINKIIKTKPELIKPEVIKPFVIIGSTPPIKVAII
jgi:hypothetical protein